MTPEKLIIAGGVALFLVCLRFYVEAWSHQLTIRRRMAQLQNRDPFPPPPPAPTRMQRFFNQLFFIPNN